ncbi:hypothetical protein GCM10009547_37390 [Sporichthya brevicatena]|uniref:Uncharacterized protein n=1 Tax=Sporichthya brevicatena TaxID=171442 RepID=A0ABP3SAB1_9ACTN
MVVAANGRFRCTLSGGQFSSPVTERIVKYIANRAAKNISSDDNHTIVPTLTMFGRLTAPCAGGLSTAWAVTTGVIMSGLVRPLMTGPAGVASALHGPPKHAGKRPLRGL